MVDGKLDDEGWVGAAKALDWSENWPGEQSKPPVDSQAWISYDDENLYIAFLLQDDPKMVRATLTERDHIWDDDYVGIILDTYGSSAWAYELFVNPLGVQGDLRWTPNGEDLSFNIVFKTEARMSEDGWSVEMEVPFKSLRFPNREVQEWRATFWRNQPRASRRRYGWAAVDRNEPCWLCQFGYLKGIEGVSAGGALEILPSVVGYDAQELNDDPQNPRLKSVDSGLDLGVGARYSISSSLAAEGTFNPDFSQVESDAAQISVNTTFALFYPEQRPFFQEGSDLYDTWVDQVYTRSINDPQWAGKLTARTSHESAGYLVAQDENTPYTLPFQERSEFLVAGRSWSNLFRVKHSYGDDNMIGVLGTDRRQERGGAGTTLGIDGRQRFFHSYSFEYQLVGSHTEEPNDPELTKELEGLSFDRGRHTASFDGEIYSGYAHYLSLERSARHWNFDTDWWATSPTFRSDNGFVYRNDRHEMDLWSGYSFYPANSPLVDEWQPNVAIGRVWNWEGLRKDEWVVPQISLNLKGQTSVSADWIFSNERFRGHDYRGIRRWEINVDSKFSETLGLGALASYGSRIARNLDVPVLGDGLDASAWSTLKPTERLTLETNWDYQELHYQEHGDEIFAGYVLRNKLNLQFSREWFLRLVAQYDSFRRSLTLEPLLSYRINAFSAIYLGSSHRAQDVELTGGGAPPYRTEFREDQRQFFFKVQYLFRS